MQTAGILVGSLGAATSTPTQRPPKSVPHHERLAILRSNNFDQVLAYKLPPKFALANYPGRARPFKNDLRHQLTQLIRCLFLSHLSHRDHSPASTKLLLTALDANDTMRKAAVQQKRSRGVAVEDDPFWTPAGVRLYGPKVLAVPDQLSAGEYLALCHRLPLWCLAAGLEKNKTAWIGMMQLLEQATICPELFDAVQTSVK
jgi:hypothetical protein